MTEIISIIKEMMSLIKDIFSLIFARKFKAQANYTNIDNIYEEIHKNIINFSRTNDRNIEYENLTNIIILLPKYISDIDLLKKYLKIDKRMIIEPYIHELKNIYLKDSLEKFNDKLFICPILKYIQRNCEIINEVFKQELE